MATTKIYDNNEWKELSGIGRPFTQDEKDKLGVVGTYTKYTDNTTQTISVNTYKSLYSFTKPANATYGIAIARVGYSLTGGGGTSRFALANQSFDVYAQDQYYKYAQISGVVLETGNTFAVTPGYREMTITSVLVEVIWF